MKRNTTAKEMYPRDPDEIRERIYRLSMEMQREGISSEEHRDLFEEKQMLLEELDHIKEVGRKRSPIG